MRALSDREKQILININNGINLFPNLIDKFLYDMGIEINTLISIKPLAPGKVDIRQVYNVKFLFSADYGYQEKDIPDKLKYIQNLIVETVNLIKFLENNGYLFLILTANEYPKTITYGNVPQNVTKIEHKFPDNHINELLAEYSVKEIFATPELDILIKNRFLSRKEIRDKKRKFISWAAIGIAIIGTFVNGYFNYMALNKTEQNNNTIQLIKINTLLDTISKEFKKYNETLKVNNKKDSIKNTIVKKKLKK